MSDDSTHEYECYIFKYGELYEWKKKDHRKLWDWLATKVSCENCPLPILTSPWLYKYDNVPISPPRILPLENKSLKSDS